MPQLTRNYLSIMRNGKLLSAECSQAMHKSVSSFEIAVARNLGLVIPVYGQSRSQRPRSFWLASGIATSGQVQLRKSAIHGIPVTLHMLRV